MFLVFVSILLLVNSFSLSFNLPFIKEKDGYMVLTSDSLIRIDRQGKLSVIKGDRKVFSEIPTFIEKPKIQEGKRINLKVTNGKTWKEFESTDIIIFSGRDIDLMYTVRKGGVEKILIIKPGTDIEKVLFLVEGAEVSKNKRGELIIKSKGGIFKLSRPTAYQYIGKNKKFIKVDYKIYKGGYGFKVGEYDRSKVLIIDPILTSLTKGGSQRDTAFTILKKGSYVYVAGSTNSNDFDHLVGNYGGGKDIFLIKFSENLKNIVSAIYYGGEGNEEVFDIKVDNSGNIYMAGYTNSNSICSGSSSEQILVVKMDPSFNQITKLCAGNSSNSRATKLLLDDSNLYVTGFTEGQIGSFTGFRGVKDAFLIKLDTKLNMLNLIYLGGSSSDEGTDMAEDGSYIYLIGTTNSSDLNGVNSTSLQTNLRGLKDAFVSKIDKSSFSLVKSTYIGGSGEDYGKSISYMSSSDNLLIGINTFSQDLSSSNGSVNRGLQDIFIAYMDKDLSNIIRSSYFGGSNNDILESVGLDPSGNIYLAGSSFSVDLPKTEGSIQENSKGGKEAFVSKLTSDLSVTICTYLGGNNEDTAKDIYLDGEYIYLTGFTNSSDFPKKYNEITVQRGTDIFVTYMTSSLLSGDSGGSLSGGNGEFNPPPAESPESGKGCMAVNLSTLPILILVLITFKSCNKRIYER